MKLKFINIATLLMLVSSFAAMAQDELDSTAIKASALADQIIEEARTHLGAPYVYGSKGPRSFDCSGFTRFVFSKFGYELSPNSASQVGQGRRVSGHVSNLQKGDLVFFSGRGGRGRVGHVGIFIEPDESGDGFRFIHAAVHGGIRISNVKEPYYASRFLGACRIIPDFGSHLTAQTDSVYVEPILVDSVDYVVAVRDTLNLGEKDRRILLLSDGSWAYVSPEGEVCRPDSTLRIVLTPDGRWSAADITLKQLPVIAETKPADSTAVQPAASKSSSSSGSGARYHTIRSGETLYSIAKKNGTTVDKLCRLNGMKSNQVLRVGKKIRVK
ncbi:MAG: NlpC/P60 family protein [Bacteroidales bacterium]|nr:NlpC/P60 family protein [Bacteroidales bacterium]